MAILSIQSHVVYGHAGNSAAVFPIQRLGRDVWAINTVEFSNHTGYGSWKGKALGGELAVDLIAGLDERGVLPCCEAVLSGYLGDASVARAITAAVRRVRSASPDALYCCDPVMGDVGRGFYVKPDIPGIFKEELIPLADIITPNQFELEALTGLDTRNINNARRAVGILHDRGPGIVLVTSYHGEDSSDSAGGKHIGMLASDRTGFYTITTPELPIGAGMAGSGDITAAVFLSRYLDTLTESSGSGSVRSGDIKKTLELCTASVYGIIKASFFARSSEMTELRIIDSQEELVSPTNFFEAHKL